ncbi:tRNA threonylcarbamoyl adenosine modification protein YeaZ [Aurantimicrobium minutum]|uniref:tRNA (adenosine(37)-N6)-threonylcarbamoyltransferase complex dimerization subunit type 1 TsaB n=1 Tax=Aurantimicrobium minutum TaxID=708131 RepID=UPI002474925B|nr:tRNA (adenosine(37)-N6)-threonylcarbamoyltransferase complex dimerization subunit type 1 TsaB [Aurantimicrobium minutum]MDH6532337.1 tRNA threonylcarbamoyl adenosine modification protein YeaZ [Aurantimicrobium minutum]
MILAIDTSAGTSVALVAGGEVLASRDTADTMRHAEIVGPFIDEILTEAGIPAAEVTHVAAGMGPGPFTGLRVGIAAADAFAFGAGAVLLPMYSHGAIALEYLEDDRENNLIVTTDARRKEEFVSFYNGLDEAGCPILGHGPALQKPGEFCAMDSGAVHATEVHAAWLGVLAHRMLAAGHSFLPAEAVYLRSPDVTLSNGPKRVGQPRSEQTSGGQK